MTFVFLQQQPMESPSCPTSCCTTKTLRSYEIAKLLGIKWNCPAGQGLKITLENYKTSPLKHFTETLISA